jgi:hypothetical protein
MLLENYLYDKCICVMIARFILSRDGLDERSEEESKEKNNS